jgi:cytochrome c
MDPQLTTESKRSVPMKKSIQTTAIVVMLITCFAALVWAESATQEEVVAKCEAAGKLIQEKGIETASQTIGDKEGPFVWKDTYVFLMDLDGKMLAHPIKPELTERTDILEVKDTNGKPLFVEFVEVAGKKGDGWVDYMWPKPGEETPSLKSSYIYRVEGTPYFVGAGIYK